MSAVRSLMLIMFANRPRPGTRSQRWLKLGFPGDVSSRRVGAMKLVRSVIVILSVLLGMPPETKSDGQDGLGLGVAPTLQEPSEFVPMLNCPSEKAPACGQPSLTKPSPSSSVLFRH